MIYIKLCLTALLPVLFSGGFYLIERYTSFRKLSYAAKQIIFGCVFGGLAILATEYGVKMDGAVMNARDAAPLCAGLIFGAPAGVISGLIGGIWRYIAAAWGAGLYTRVACTISTILSGIFAALLRKFMFEDKKPAWVYGFMAGLVMEVFHMLMVFLTNLNDARTAFLVVKKCSATMIVLNSLSVGIALLLVTLLSREALYRVREKTPLTQTFQRRLLLCVVIAFLLTGFLTYNLQTQVSDNQTNDMLRQSISDIEKDVENASGENLLTVTRQIAQRVPQPQEQNITGTEYLRLLCEEMGVTEINLVNEKGVITDSSYEGFIGYDMSTGTQSAEFLILLGSPLTEYVQTYQPAAFNKNLLRKYAAVSLPDGGFVQVAYGAEEFQQNIAQNIRGATRNRHVGENGFIIIADESFTIVSDPNSFEDQPLAWTGLDLQYSFPPDTRFVTDVYNTPSYCMYSTAEGYYIIAVMPVQEADLARDVSIYLTLFMEVLIFAALFILVYFLIKRLIVNNIRKVNTALAQITAGNLDVTVDVRSNQEFASLSDDINVTVDTLHQYIDEATQRIDKELQFAKTIQASALPRVFPPYPNRKEFSIFASMVPAKEVGGDFYDFYLLGEDKLAFLIADVSGKGIPAAMFMMTAKTMLKNYTESGAPVEEVFTRTNAGLCENNEAGMFVTAWMGILDLHTGLVTFANAGHNPPLVYKKDGSFTYLRSRAGFVLAGMEGMQYKRNELQLEPGDRIYLYTDGVTEATDEKNELYGEERLQNRLNTTRGLTVETLCETVKKDVDGFVGKAPQFDDITMLCVEFQKFMQ